MKNVNWLKRNKQNEKNTCSREVLAAFSVLNIISYLYHFGVQRKGPQGNRCHYENDSDDGNGIPYAKGTGKNQERFGRRN